MVERRESALSLGREILRLSREHSGVLSFDQFLDCVLYHPTWGYYGRKSIFGRGGDYQTAPRVHPIFGWTVAREVEREWVRQGRPTTFTLLEVGPGEGNLTGAIVEYLTRERGLPLENWEVLLVDKFPRPGALTSLPPGLRLQWESSLEVCPPFHGVVLANELLDAMPFHSLSFHEGQWRERYVRVDAGFAPSPGADDPLPRLSWVLGPLSRQDLASGLPGVAKEGVMVEVSSRFGPFFQEVSRVLTEGSVLLFDYGDTRTHLIERRPEGTLETFSGHAAGTDPFDRLGESDIGCWVDFTSVMEEARRSGLRMEGFWTQAEALHAWGLDELVREAERRGSVEGVRARLALKTFYFAYTNHRVLSLRKERRNLASPLTARDR